MVEFPRQLHRWIDDGLYLPCSVKKVSTRDQLARLATRTSSWKACFDRSKAMQVSWIGFKTLSRKMQIWTRLAIWLYSELCLIWVIWARLMTSNYAKFNLHIYKITAWKVRVMRFFWLNNVELKGDLADQSIRNSDVKLIPLSIL